MDPKTLILDPGANLLKIGYSGDLAPKLFFPSQVQIDQSRGFSVSDENQKIVFGQKIYENYDENPILSTIRNGLVQNWEMLEAVFEHIFISGNKGGKGFKEYGDNVQVNNKNNEFHEGNVKENEGENNLEYNNLNERNEIYNFGDISENGIFMMEEPKVPKRQREKMTELLFEKLGVKFLYFNNSAVLSLYGACKFSGFVMDSGYDLTKVVPIQNGYMFDSAVELINVGGRHISKKLLQLLVSNSQKSDIKIPLKSSDISIKKLNEIKEQFCTLLDDKNKKEEYFSLPDGRKIILGDESFQATDVLYHPESIGEKAGGIMQIIIGAYNKTKVLKSKEFEDNIILCGGCSFINGFEDRLKKELFTFQSGKYKDKFNIISLPERNHLSWIGASIFSLMNIFKGLCTTKGEYEEYGASIVHNKCFY